MSFSTAKKLALFCSIFLSGCRTDRPPPFNLICTLDGLGGADCVKGEASVVPDGCQGLEDNKVYCPPSAMTNFWATTQSDMAAFSSWCYDTSKKNADKALGAIRANIESR